MELHFVTSMDEVLKIALEREVQPLPMPSPAATESAAVIGGEEKVTH
jgi:hypothetical protein